MEQKTLKCSKHSFYARNIKSRAVDTYFSYPFMQKMLMYSNNCILTGYTNMCREFSRIKCHTFY